MISDKSVKNWDAGEKILKKSPGLINLKYSFPAITELGILLSVAAPITIELKTFENKTPLETATDMRRIIFFIFVCLD